MHSFAILSSAMAGLLLASGARATPRPMPADIAKALVEQGHGRVPAADIRVHGCAGFDEEPTEFTCSWSQRSGRSWQRFTTYFALDGKGWHIIDWPPSRG